MEENVVPSEDNINRICRTCMRSVTDTNKSMVLLFADDLESSRFVQMLNQFAGLQMVKTDPLPKQVCMQCVSCVNNFQQFISKAKQTDEILRDFLITESKVKIETNIKQEENIDIVYEFDINFAASDSDSESDKPLIQLEKKKIKTEIKKEKVKEDAKKERTHCCTKCGKLFEKPSKLKRHEKVHERDGDKVLIRECLVCSKKFKKECQLKRHMIIHDEKTRPFQCHICQRRFRTNNRLLAHLITHGPTSNTGIDVKNESDNSRSMVKAEQEDANMCKQCNKSFESYFSLCAHMRKHFVPGRIRACSVCGKVFKKTSHLKRHEQTHEDKRPFKCTQCPRSFGTEVLLQEHINKHKGVKPHECPVCGKAFSQRGTLTCHLRVHTKERPYLCPTCGKRFDSSTNLKQHQRRHAGDKAFACTLCPNRFVSKGELKSHMSTHTGARPFVCDACGAAFTKPNSLLKHKLRHLGIKPHECDVCLLKFTCKEHLKRHYRIHTGEKPYKCDMCDRAFTQSNDLIKHKRSHLGDNLYKCQECSQGFRLKTELRNHISEHFISSKVAQGIPITIPADIIPNNKSLESVQESDPIPPNSSVPLQNILAMKSVNDSKVSNKKAHVIVTCESDETVLTMNKLTDDSSDLAEHVKNIPTAITVKKIKITNGRREFLD